MTHVDGILCYVKLHFERKSGDFRMLTVQKEKVTLVISAKHDIHLRLQFSGDQNFMIWTSFPLIKDEMLMTTYQIACMVLHSTCSLP
jgi:hypothetical protein